jgi:short-subunit dehydrogenase
MTLSGKWALVTGASSGIGYEMTKQLAQKGCSVILASRSKAKLEEIKNEIEKNFTVKAFVLISDLSSLGSAEALYQECKKQGLSPDILINNAGVGMMGEAVAQNINEVQNMLLLNIVSLTALCRLFGSDMKEKGAGFILNVASMAGLLPIPYFTAYSASKHYVVQYSLALRSELKKSGVSVTCLLPGFTRTNFDQNAGVLPGGYQAFSEGMGMTALQVAKIGLKALFNRRKSVVAGFSNKIGAFFIRFLPKSWLSDVIYSVVSGLVKK